MQRPDNLTKAPISRFCPDSCTLSAIFQALCRLVCVLTVQILCMHVCHFPASMRAQGCIVSHSHGSGSVHMCVHSFLESRVRIFHFKTLNFHSLKMYSLTTAFSGQANNFSRLSNNEHNIVYSVEHYSQNVNGHQGSWPRMEGSR